MRRLSLVLVALTLACDSTELSEPAPDLTGLYTLVSYTVDGLTDTPPRVRAVLELSQHAVEDGWARGDARFQMRRLKRSGGRSSTSVQGGYRHDATERMVMSLSHIGFAGDYTLKGDTLITDMISAQELNSDLSPSAKIVWLRDDSP